VNDYTGYAEKPKYGYQVDGAGFGIVKEQAEISFKAGIKEAVEWIKKHELIEPDKDSLTRFEPFYQIEAKELKELGID